MTGAAIVAAGLLILTGCATPDREPSPDLAPEFLAVICPANDADLAFNSVWEAEASTVEQIVEVATKAGDASTQAAASLDALAARWPEEYRTDLEVMERMYTQKVADYLRVAEAISLDSFADLSFSNPTAGHAAYERIAGSIDASINQC